jgi:hypothetical protein
MLMAGALTIDFESLGLLLLCAIQAGKRAFQEANVFL